MRWRTMISTMAAAAVATLGLAAPAQASLTTYCEGVASDVTVPNDLVVPENSSCELTKVTIQGDAVVEAGADLIVDDVAVTGSLTAGEGAYIDAGDSQVDGNLDLNSAYGAYIEGSEINNAYAENSGFLYSIESEYGNVLDSVNGETYLVSSVVGNIATDGDLITDIYDTWVSGAFQVSNSEQGSVICSSEIDGNAIFQHNGGIIQISADESLDGCATSYVGGNLHLSENAADSVISDTIVQGRLNCMDNDPAPVGENNRVRGGQFNQCENMESPVDASSLSSDDASGDRVESRKQQVIDKKEERTAEGEEKAAEIGPADIGQ